MAMQQSVAQLAIPLPTEADTDRLAVWFAQHLRAGDCLLLSGPIGAGKTHFARRLIRSRLGHYEDVPSPTFTLVQTYQADVEIWHADLYRLSHPDEAMELGLDAAFDTAICLVEWPDRLGKSVPKSAMTLSMAVAEEGRVAVFSAPFHPDLIAILSAEWFCND